MVNNNDLAIKVTNVSKTFKLPHEKQSSIKGVFLNTFKGKRTYEKQKALENITFDVKRGEFFGIVGRNGGGKSTLLKLLAGIYSPDNGQIEINGKLTPFIELGVGFNPELTGRENVFLNGALLGFNRKQMSAMYDEIVDFAELSRFMDQKLKNYSSGMQVRLAFSIAIRAKSDILLIDEVLAVGDAAFQKKCFDVFRQLKEEGRTIVLVTHDMGNVERFCDRALVINKGEQIALSSPSEAAALYARLNIKEEGIDTITQEVSNRWGYGGVTVEKVTILNDSSHSSKVFKTGDDITFKVRIKREKKYEKTPIVCGFGIHNQDNINIAGPNSSRAKIKQDNNEFVYTIQNAPFAPGEYKLTIALYDSSLTTPFDVLDKWTSFTMISDHAIHGNIELKDGWKS